MSRFSQTKSWVWALLAGALATWARISDWVGGAAPALIASDSHYYVRFARLQLAHLPAFENFDSFVNFPEGADILWPPLHTLLVAAAVSVGGHANAELAAGWVGPIVAGLEVAVLVTLARRFAAGGQAAVMAAAWVLLPVAVEAGALGNADHHVHELFFPPLTALLAQRLVLKPSGAIATALGASIGLGRFFTTSSFIWLPGLALGLYVASRELTRDDVTRVARAVSLAGIVAVLLLLAGAAWCHALRSLDYETFSGFHLLWSGAWLFGLAAAFWRQARAPRATQLLLFTLSIASLMALVPEAARALTHLSRRDPLLSQVMESTPLLFEPSWALRLFGPALVALPLAALVLWRQRNGPNRRAALPSLVMVAWLCPFALAQARFAPALAGVAAIVIGLGAGALLRDANRSAARLVAIVGCLSLLLVARPLLPLPSPTEPNDPLPVLRPSLEWMRQTLPQGSNPPTWGVATWPLLGHLVLLWADKPVLGTPFSQRAVHVRGNQRAVELLNATNDEEAYRLAVESRVRYVVATPFQAEPRASAAGASELTTFLRLYRHVGFAPDEPPTSHFRWLHDSAETFAPAGKPAARIFEVVPGATLEFASGPCWAETDVLAGGLTHRYRLEQLAAAGSCRLVAAYPGDYRYGAGALSGSLSLSDEQVVAGAHIQL